jgi:hypothetical protein
MSHRSRRLPVPFAEDPSPMLAVYDGQRCRGHLIGRGRSGFDAFDEDDVSLGFFPDQESASIAIWAAADGR